MFASSPNKYRQVRLPDSKEHKRSQEIEELVALVQGSGYPVEVHVATTCDGVELTTFRLPRHGHPVLLQHGLLDSAWMWVISKESWLCFGGLFNTALLRSRLGFPIDPPFAINNSQVASSKGVWTYFPWCLTIL